jgi:hypothetical protein
MKQLMGLALMLYVFLAIPVGLAVCCTRIERDAVQVTPDVISAIKAEVKSEVDASLVNFKRDNSDRSTRLVEGTGNKVDQSNSDRWPLRVMVIGQVVVNVLIFIGLFVVLFTAYTLGRNRRLKKEDTLLFEVVDAADPEYQD